MSRRVSLKKVSKRFVKISYRIDWVTRDESTPIEVSGYAFETPGFPEFRACVRYGSRFHDGLFDDWIIDHYDTGLAVSLHEPLKRREDAPALLAKRLSEVGRDKVLKALMKYGITE
jgi:hypothetical protein